MDTNKENNKDDIQLSELILASLEGVITPENFNLLQSRIAKEPRVAQIYVDFMLNHAIMALREQTSIASTVIDGAGNEATDWQFWKELAETEKTSPTVVVPSPADADSKMPVSAKNIRIDRVTRPVNKFTLMTALISVAAVVMLIVLVQFRGNISHTAVATLVDSYQAEWADPSAEDIVGKRITSSNDLKVLKTGMVKIAFDYGAETIIEGPAMFALRSAEQLYLAGGKIYAYVPPQATGFIVETPSSKVVDLGTEFGISVTSRGESLIQMYKGKASVISGRRGQPLSQVLLTEGDAGKVNSETGEFSSTTFDRTVFVQSFDSQQKLVWRGEHINLADIVGGGDGLGTGQLNAGINYEGEIKVLEAETSAKGPTGYIRVSSNIFVDGIFIPNGPTQVASKNLNYPFEQTNGRYWLGVLNGAWHQVSVTSRVPRHNLRLNGKVYGITGNPAICLDANQGVTFDLNAIRGYFHREPARFSALCGISETYNDYVNSMDSSFYSRSPKASFYVLVDGKLRFEKTDTTPSSPVSQIDIPLGPGDRFLTLVTTQGSDGTNNGDWTLFAEPVLQLK